MIRLTNKQRKVEVKDRDGNVVHELAVDGWDTSISELMNEFAGAETELIRESDPQGGDGFEYDNNSVIHSLLYREDTSTVTYNGQHIATFTVSSTADVAE